MIVPCVAGCSSKTDDEAIDNVNEEASESAITLAMYLLSEKEVTEEQANKIETAVNKITESKFKTRLELFFYTEDKYYDALEASFAARAEAEKAGLIKQPTASEESTEEETYEDEYGVSRIKYPTISGYQVDIFYLHGYDKFLKYMDMGMLAKLDEELSSASKKLNSYMSSSYLTYMKSMNNGTYALPTNDAIGEYTYLLINKDVLEKESSDTPSGIAQYKNLTCDAMQKLLKDVDDYYKDYVPLYSCLGEDGLPLSGIRYWGTDDEGRLSNDFSILGSSYTQGALYKQKASYAGNIGNILEDVSFKSQLKTLKQYKKDGYFGTEQDFNDGKVAVAYVKGGADIVDKYGDKYEAVVIEKPTLTTEDLYENMFAVSTYSSSLSRSMEIVTYLNTDEEFRNLILYGIEGENYELVNSEYEAENGDAYKVVKRLNEDYLMDVNKTGNTLLAYTQEGDDPTLREYIKEQNNSSVIDITMGFTLNYNGMSIDKAQLDVLNEASAAVLEKLKNVTYDNFDADIAEIINDMSNEVKSALEVLKVASEPADSAETCGLGYMYNQWAEKLGIYSSKPED